MPGHKTDTAIDHSEFAFLGPAHIAEVVQIMLSAGLNATVRSIHTNGRFGSYNKLEGARWIACKLPDCDLDTEMNRRVCIGNPANDRLLFEAFASSIGVADARRCET